MPGSSKASAWRPPSSACGSNQVMINHPNDHALFFKTIQLLIRAVSAQTNISKGSPQPSEQLIENILRDVGLKLGLKAIPWPRD